MVSKCLISLSISNTSKNCSVSEQKNVV